MYNPPTFARGQIVSKSARLTLLLVFSFAGSVEAQGPAPNAYQVLMYSSTLPSGVMPSIYSYNSTPCQPSGCGAALTTASNFKAIPSIVGLTSALSASIGTALSVIPVASPSSSVITITDPETGAQLPASSTLGPIFAERGETIGKHRVYVGISTQNFHFTSLNGEPLRQPLSMLDTGGQVSQILNSADQPVATYPSTYNLATDVRLSQNVALITYGVTSRFDVSVGLQVAHASIQSQTTNGQIYVGDGFNNTKQGNCWCVDTFTAGVPPGATGVPGSGLILSDINSSKYGATGFGDMLLRFKGTVVQRSNLALAVGADLRLPTGDAQNFLGIGTTAIKPFLAASFYSKALGHGIVLSPELNVGWQFAGKSILGGQIAATSSQTVNGVTEFGPPFTTTKNYLPDVFSWTVGTELALGPRSTFVADILGNQIGWIHGIANTSTQSVAGVPVAQTTPGAAPVLVTATGLVSVGRVSYGQYSGAFGYKSRLYRDLVGTFNVLVRFDNNGLGLVDRSVLLFGLGYTF